jgi:hypothetical protein
MMFLLFGRMMTLSVGKLSKAANAERRGCVHYRWHEGALLDQSLQLPGAFHDIIHIASP